MGNTTMANPAPLTPFNALSSKRPAMTTAGKWSWRVRRRRCACARLDALFDRYLLTFDPLGHGEGLRCGVHCHLAILVDGLPLRGVQHPRRQARFHDILLGNVIGRQGHAPVTVQAPVDFIVR